MSAPAETFGPLGSDLRESLEKDINMHPALSKNPVIVGILSILANDPTRSFELTELSTLLSASYEAVRYAINFLLELTERFPDDLSFTLKVNREPCKTTQLTSLKDQFTIKDCEEGLLACSNLQRRDMLIVLITLLKKTGPMDEHTRSSSRCTYSKVSGE